VSVPAGEFDHDGDLVHAVQGGDLDAFTELFRRHYPSVHRACARRLRDSVEADEVAQATFVRALERIHQCRGDRRFGPWVHVIARHLCIDHRRARARVILKEAPLSDNHSDGSRPEDPLLELEQRDRVHQAIADLPERQRRAVTARALGLRPGEIAATLGLSIGAVDSLLLRARRRLALTYTSMASEGGAAAATTGTSATASLGGALVVDHTQLTEGVAAAAGQVASAVGSLPGVRPAGGLVSAVVGAAMALGGSGQGAAPAVPDPALPAPATVTVTADPGAVAPAPGGPEVVVDHRASGPGAVTVTLPGVGGAIAPVTDLLPVARGLPAPAPAAGAGASAPAGQPAGGTGGGPAPLHDVPVVGDVVAAVAEPGSALPVEPPAVAPVELPVVGNGGGAPPQAAPATSKGSDTVAAASGGVLGGVPSI